MIGIGTDPRGAEECYCAGKYFSDDNMGGGDGPARGDTVEPNLQKDGERILPELGTKDGNQNDKMPQWKEKPEVEQENAQHPWPRELAKAPDNATSLVDLTNERTTPKNSATGDPEDVEQPLWETGKQILETLMQSKREHELEPKEKAAKDQVSSVWGPDDSDSDDVPTVRRSSSFRGARKCSISIGRNEETQQSPKAANEDRKETEVEDSDDEQIIRKLSSRHGSKVGRALSPKSDLDKSMDHETGGSKQIPNKSGNSKSANTESGNDNSGEEDEDIDSLKDFIAEDSEVIEAANETEVTEADDQENSKSSPAKVSDVDNGSDDIRARRFQEKGRTRLADTSGNNEDSDEIPVRNLRKRLREKTPWERRLRARPCGCPGGRWRSAPHYCGDAFKKIRCEIGPEPETKSESESEDADEGEEGNGGTGSV
jgi:hypothetical protein